MANSDIARTTLICSWRFVALATISIIIQGPSIHQRRAHVGIDDWLLSTAYLVSVLLVSQTTWAVVDEGQGMHEAEFCPAVVGSVLLRVCVRVSIRFMIVKEAESRYYGIYPSRKFSGDA